MPRSTRHLRVRRLKAEIIPLFDLLDSENLSLKVPCDLSLFYNYLLNRFDWFQLDILQQFDELDPPTNMIHPPFPSDISAYISILPATAQNRLQRFQLEIPNQFDLDSTLPTVIPLMSCDSLGSQLCQSFNSRMPYRAPNKSFRRRQFPFPINHGLQLRSMVLPICSTILLIYSLARYASPLARKTPSTYLSMDDLQPLLRGQPCHQSRLLTYRWVIRFMHRPLSYPHAGPDSITYASFHWNIISQRRNPRPFPRAGVG